MSRKKQRLGMLRRATLDDASEIRLLLTEANVKLFRCETTYDIRQLILKSTLSICQLDESENVIGFAALTDYPPIPHLHPSAWEDYVWARYKLIDMNARNTLFIHLLCWSHECKEISSQRANAGKGSASKPLSSRDIVFGMLHSVFMHDCYVHYVCMVKMLPNSMPLDANDSSVESLFRQVAPAQGVRGVPSGLLPAIMLLARPDICPRLRIRRAVEEDNDDIVPIVDAQSTRLRQLYGDFYVSELVSRHPESERVLLVAEHMEVAVGVMVLNTTINYDRLDDSFVLEPYNGLRKPSALALAQAAAAAAATVATADAQEVESTIDISGDILTTASMASSAAFFYPETMKDERTKRQVSFSVEGQAPAEGRPSMAASSMGLGHRRSSVPRRRLYYLALLEQEEELDFDIVNIERSLLHVPHTLSFDSFIYGIDSEASTEGSDNPSRHSTDCNERRKGGAQLSTSSTTRREPEAVWQRRRSEGVPDAFLIELFAMHPMFDERHGFDLLEVAYEVFPECSYCVIAMPTDHVAYPLLENFTLVTPLPGRNKLTDQSLYVAHRNSVRGRVSIRPAEQFDLVSATHLLDHTPRHVALLDQFADSLISTEMSSFMLLSENQPVGLVTLGPVEDIMKVRSQFIVNDGSEDCSGSEPGMVLAALLAPALEPHARWFMRELLRHTGYSDLFWSCRLNGRGDAVPGRNLMSLTGHMLPSRPRRFIPNLDDKENKDLDRAKAAAPFALWHLHRPLTSMSKLDINHSIVVVGASATGLAFIEKLLFGPSSAYLSFTNVTLVTAQGLPTMPDSVRALSTFVVHHNRFDDRYLKMVPFHFYVDVIIDSVVKIDRKKKCITMHSGSVKHYDDLYLTCGVQFQHPHYLREELDRERQFEQGAPCRHSAMDDPEHEASRLPTPPRTPANVMLVNGIVCANKSLLRLMSLLHDSPRVNNQPEHNLSASSAPSIAVYGACIEALSCLAALMEVGLPPSCITYIEPFPPEDPKALRVQDFNNETVDLRVRVAIEASGVSCYRGYSFAGWSMDGEGSVRAVRLLSRHHTFELPCFALFYYGKKSIDVNAFCAINSCGLVYDGGLVVDPQFVTNDPHIFGAGTSTRYSRQLHANRFLHEHYRSEDVGTALGEMVLQKLDPFRVEPELPSFIHESISGSVKAAGSAKINRNSTSGLRSGSGDASNSSNSALRSSNTTTILPNFKPRAVQQFKSPIICAAALPGSYYYLGVREPGPFVPAAVASCMHDQGHTMITDKNENYFELTLNQQHTVSRLTCLSKVQFPWDLFVQLYGKHEQLLNKLLVRFKSGMVDDLYEYFTSAWLTAVYRDDFSDLLKDIDDLTIDIDGETHGTFKDIIQDLVCRSNDPTMERGRQEVEQAVAYRWKELRGGSATDLHLMRWLRPRHPQMSVYSCRKK